MSMTYAIRCKTCKEWVWVGQSNYIYDHDTIPFLSEWLKRHQSADYRAPGAHELDFVNIENGFDTLSEPEEKWREFDLLHNCFSDELHPDIRESRKY